MKDWIDGPAITSDLFTHVVNHRAISKVEHFLNPVWPNDLHDPFLLPDMEKAVERLWRAIMNHEQIGIVGDYDMDGTPASALLFDFLRLFNLSPVVILPKRSDGYGFSPQFVKRLCQQGVNLIITVDCGIRDKEAVSVAAQHKCDVIITDHHTCDEVLPAAHAVINPKRSDSKYPFSELSGTGVAFKFVSALIQTAPSEYRSSIPTHWLAWSLDLVALATISDMVPLIDENRLFVRLGLPVLRKGRRPGLVRFYEAIQISPSNVSYSDITFKIIPRCNASGRMYGMDDVFTLLSSQNVTEVDRAIKQILQYETQSQLLLSEMLDQAREKIKDQDTASIVLLADDRWHPGLTGLAAMRLVEEYKCPVGILAPVDTAIYRGSLRSIPGVNLPQLLTQTSQLLEKFGGHDQAAGLSVPKQNLSALQEALGTALTKFKQSGHRPMRQTEGTLQPNQITLEAVTQLDQLMPWGISNEEPLWSMNQITLQDVRWLSEGRHLKAMAQQGNQAVQAIFFNAAKAQTLIQATVDVYGTVSINEFRGKREPQFVIKGISRTSA